MIRPHGDVLVERVASQEKTKEVERDLGKWTKISVDPEKIQDIANIAHGVYSPLTGFLREADFQSVLQEGRLENRVPWTIPIVLDVQGSSGNGPREGEEIVLTNSEGQHIALFCVEEKFSYSKDEYASHVFGTTDTSHPGVEKVYRMGICFWEETSNSCMSRVCLTRGSL